MGAAAEVQREMGAREAGEKGLGEPWVSCAGAAWGACTTAHVQKGTHALFEPLYLGTCKGPAPTAAAAAALGVHIEKHTLVETVR